MRKFKERIKKIIIKPFPQELTVVVTNDIRASAKKRSKTHNIKVTEIAYAYTWLGTDCTEMLMVLPDKARLSVIVHECVHVISHTMKQNDVSFDDENWAYHIDELFEQIATFVHSWKK